MLKQNLLGSEVLAMLSVHVPNDSYLAHGYMDYRSNPYMGAINRFPSQQTQLLYSVFEYINKDAGKTEYIVSDIPIVLMEHLYNTISFIDNIIHISPETLNTFIDRRLKGSVIKLAIDTGGREFVIRFDKSEKSANTDGRHPSNLGYSLQINYLKENGGIGEDLPKEDALAIFRIVNDIISTLKYDEYLCLKE